MQNVGAVAQLGERYVRNVEVRGSIPLGSTIFLNGCVNAPFPLSEKRWPSFE
jgi:hypothetical protein